MDTVPSVPTLFVLWALVTALAGPVVGYGSWRLMALSAVDPRALMDVVRRLMSAGNRSRAARLALAAPEAPALRLLGFALRVRLPAADPHAVVGDGYRDGAVGRPLVDRARDTLLGRARVEAAPADAWWVRVMLATTPVVLTAVPVLVTGQGNVPAVLAVTTAVVGLMLYSTAARNRLRTSLAGLAQALAGYVLAEGSADPDPDTDPDAVILD